MLRLKLVEWNWERLYENACVIANSNEEIKCSLVINCYICIKLQKCKNSI